MGSGCDMGNCTTFSSLLLKTVAMSGGCGTYMCEHWRFFSLLLLSSMLGGIDQI